jgi:hypothetical protein
MNAAAPEPVQLACGHHARDFEPIVIKPTGKLKFECAIGCRPQPAQH